MNGLVLEEQGDRLRLRIKVVPRARRTEFAGHEEGVLVVRVAAPPVDGKANAAVVELFAQALGLRQSQIEIESGEKARHKRIALEGASPQSVQELARGKET